MRASRRSSNVDRADGREGLGQRGVAHLGRLDARLGHPVRRQLRRGRVTPVGQRLRLALLPLRERHAADRAGARLVLDDRRVHVYAIVGGKFGRVSAQDTSIQQLDVFNQVYAKIKNDYVDQPSMTAAMVGAIRGLLEQVDPYSGYLNPKDVAFYKDFSVEKTPGIGVILTKANGYPDDSGSDSRGARAQRPD